MPGWGKWAFLALWIAAAPIPSVAQQAEPVMKLADLQAFMKDERIITMRAIPAENMLPALLVGDRVAVGKLDAPARGDVIVFNHPRSPRVMVSRVIGLAGDTIEMREGLLYLNGVAVPREKIRKVIYVPDGERGTRTAIEYRETLPASDGRAARVHLIHEFSDTEALDETPIFKVPPGHIFLMGDSRDNSEDSRAPSGHRAIAAQLPEAWPKYGTSLHLDPSYDAIGFVPVENIIGRVVAVAFSLHGCTLTKEEKAAGAECLVSQIGQRP
ncbi:MAG: signal peptidase I [Hyphomonadaceae bacterium]